MKNFLKYLKIAGIVLGCLIVLGLIGGFIFLKTFDIKKYKTKIITAADKALGRQVEFDDIQLRVSLKEGIRFHLTDLTVSENPDFAKGDFAKIKEVSIGVDLLSFLNARQISVPNILVKSPEFTIISNAKGALNIQSIGQSQTAAGSPAKGSSSGSSASAALPAIFINSLRIEGAQLTYIDQSVTPNFQASVSKMDVKLDRFSLAKPFNFSVEAAVLSPERNLKIDGNANLNVLAKEARLSDVHVDADLGQFPLADLRRLPLLKGVPIPEVLEGKYTGTIKECVLSDKGIGALNLDSQLDSGRIVIKDVAPGISIDVAGIYLTVTDFSFGKPFSFSLQAAYMAEEQNLNGNGNVTYDMASKSIRLDNVTFNVNLSSLPLARMKAELAPLKDVPLPHKLSGNLEIIVKQLTAGPQGLGDFALDANLKEGNVSFKNIIPGSSFDVSKINLAVNDFSLNAPFKVSLQMAYLNESPDIDLQGTAALDMKTQSVHLENFKVGVDLGLLSFGQLKLAVPSAQGMPLPKTLGGKLDVTVKKLDMGPKGLGDFLVSAEIKDGILDIKDIVPGTSFEASKINLSVNDFSLNAPFTFALQMLYLNGVPDNEFPDIDLQGTAALDIKTQSVSLENFKANIDLGLISLEKLRNSVGQLQGVPLPEKIGGKLEALLKKLEVGPQGVKALSMNAHLSDGSIWMSKAAPGISLIANKIDFDVHDFSLGAAAPFGCKLKMAYLSDAQNVNFDGSVIYDMPTQGVKLKDSSLGVDLSHVDVGELRSSVAALSSVPLPETVSGELKVAIKDLSAGAKGLDSVHLDVNLDNGAFSFKDITPGVSVAVSQIGLELKNFSLGQDAIAVRLNAAYLSDKPNLDLTGTAFLDVAQSAIQMKDTTFKTDLSSLSMDQLRASVATLKNASLPQELKGLLNVQINEVTAGPKGLVSFISHGELASAMIKLKELTVPIDIAQVKFQADGINVKFDDVLATIAKGKINAKATIDQYLTKPIFNQEITIEGLDLAEVLEQKDAPVKVQGLVNASLKAQGDPSDIKSIIGDGNFEIKEAKLKDLNVLKAVFDGIKIPLIPNLSSLVMGALPEEYRKQFEKPDTDLKSVKWAMNISKGRIRLDPIDVQSDVFAFTGDGDMGFDQSYSIDGSFNLSKDLSDLLVRDLENPFAYMVDGQNLVSFPVHVKGKGTMPPKFVPDATLKDVAKNAIKSRGAQELGKVLNKVFNKGDAPSDNTSQTNDQTDPSKTQEKSPERQLIDGVLGTIFK